MSNNPLNLAVRFILELVILFALGYWAFKTQPGYWKYILMILLPLASAGVWGIFRVPADQGKGLVAIPGMLRLVLGIILFTVAWYYLKNSGRPQWALWLVLVSSVHYLLSYNRIWVLLRN
jgi:hypothetical protein